MKKTLKRIFGTRPKSAVDTLAPRTQHPNPNRASAPPAVGRARSMDDLNTYFIPDTFDNDMQTSVQRVQMTARENSSTSLRTSRTSQFQAAQQSLQANFPQARVVDAGQFPGKMELLEGVHKEDTRFLVAMNPEDSTQYLAVNLVIFTTTGSQQQISTPPATSPGLRPIVVAQDALAHLLRQWQCGGVSDGYLAVVSMGTESSVQVFRAKEGLVDLPA